MKLSEKRTTELYSAIADPITDLRISNLRKSGGLSMDDSLFELQNEIWRRVHKVLKLESPA